VRDKSGGERAGSFWEGKGRIRCIPNEEEGRVAISAGEELSGFSLLKGEGSWVVFG